MRKIPLVLIIIGVVFLLSGCSDWKENIVGTVTGEKKMVRVAGDSMAPAIKSNSLLFYSKEPYENLKVGDIVIYQDPQKNNKQVINRIIEKTDDEKYLTEQDNRKGHQTVMTKEMYLGRQ